MSRVFYRKRFSDYLGEQRAIDDIITFYEPDPSPTPIPVTPTPTPTPSVTPSVTPNPTITPTQTKTPTPTPSFVSYSGLFCSGNTQNDACFCINPSVTLYSSQPFYTLSQQVYTDAGLTNQISVGLFLSSGGTAYEYQYIYFNPSLEIVGSCPTPTPTITSTPTITHTNTLTPTPTNTSSPTPTNTPVPVTPTPSVTSTVTPTITSTVTPTVTTTNTPTPTLTPTNTPTPTEPGGYKLLAESGANLQSETPDDINIEH